jgi:hypothetical protein
MNGSSSKPSTEQGGQEPPGPRDNSESLPRPDRLSNFVASEALLSVSEGTMTAVRSGSRTVLRDDFNGYRLGTHIAGQLPYHYRPLEGILADFEAQHSALEAVWALAAALPTSSRFRNSHCGEILASHFVEQRLGYTRLYSKLTLTTSENTNVHKMDGLFVDTRSPPYSYLFVEAKTSILPTQTTLTKSHRSGILSQMVDSLTGYSSTNPRFELTRIRDNLAKHFNTEQQAIIRGDLVPPGPVRLNFLGVAVTNATTVNSDDDDWILCAECGTAFNFHGLVVTDLAALAAEAYGHWDAMKGTNV